MALHFLFYNSGFLCPVHTPDGSPCGLLNHMAASCQVNNNGETVMDGEKLVNLYIITRFRFNLVLVTCLSCVSSH